MYPFHVCEVLDLSSVTLSHRGEPIDLASPDLRDIMERAPIGRHGYTVIDLDERRAWQQSDVVFEGLDLTAHVQEAVDKMNLGARIEVRFAKITMYEEGGFFKPHTDTLRAESHVASAVLVLEEAKGGELVVSHRGERSRGSHAAGALHVFFADCPHEVERVREGRRITALFEVHQISYEAVTPGHPSSPPDGRMCPLAHRYHGSVLDTLAFRGEDRDFVATMWATAIEQGVSLHLVEVDITTIESYDSWSITVGARRALVKGEFQAPVSRDEVVWRGVRPQRYVDFSYWSGNEAYITQHRIKTLALVYGERRSEGRHRTGHGVYTSGFVEEEGGDGPWYTPVRGTGKKYLSLSDTTLDVEALPDLVGLTLDNVQLTDSSRRAIEQCRSLRFVHMSFSGGFELDYSQLEHLEELHLVHSGHKGDLPRGIGNHSRLRSLRLPDLELPTVALHLERLDTLELGKVEAFTALHLPALRWASVNVASLELDLSAMPRLRSLVLRYCDIAIQGEFSHPHLEELELVACQIGSFDVSKLPNLRAVRLVALDECPTEFDMLRELERLEITSCGVSQWPSMPERLRILCANDNPLTAFPPGLHSLEYLSLRNCAVERLPEDLSMYDKLRDLMLYLNPLQEEGAVRALRSLPALTRLNLMSDIDPESGLYIDAELEEFCQLHHHDVSWLAHLDAPLYVKKVLSRALAHEMLSESVLTGEDLTPFRRELDVSYMTPVGREHVTSDYWTVRGVIESKGSSIPVMFYWHAWDGRAPYEVFKPDMFVWWEEPLEVAREHARAMREFEARIGHDDHGRAAWLDALAEEE